MLTVNFQMFKLVLEKAEEPEIKLPTSVGSSKKQESSRKNIYFCFIDYAEAFDCVDHDKLWKILKDDAVKLLHSIYQQIWRTHQWPQDWKRSVFIPIPKKGNAKECSNYCTIALISAAAAAKSLQLCPTLCDPTDGSPPCSPIPGILQARTLEWVAISFSNA